jgi:hypothetical protein
MRDIWASSSDLQKARRWKGMLRAQRFPPEDVARYIAAFYDDSAYRPLLTGMEAVFLVMPSTSGENAIPAVFASRLARDFGGEVVEFGRALATKEAKRRRDFSSKLLDPTSFRLDISIDVYAGRSLVLVDDVFSSGESVVAARRALGADASAVVLAAGPADPIERGDLEELARRLAGAVGDDYADVERRLAPVLAGGYRALVDAANKELDRDPGAARRIIGLLGR